MLSGLRYFEHALKDNGRGQPKVAFSWGAVDMVSVARCFMQLCAKAMDVFTSEPRLLDFTSPSYVLGTDILCLYVIQQTNSIAKGYCLCDHVALIMEVWSSQYRLVIVIACCMCNIA